jgi:hypothetical protein
MSLQPIRFVSTLVATLLCCIAPSVGATNSIRIDQVYSNLDGTVQYIQLRETGGANGQNRLAGLKLRSVQNSVSKEFAFPADLPSDMTANEWVLIATTDCVPFYGFPIEAIGEWNCVAPDFRIPERFLSTDGGTIDFIGVDQISYASLPTDGVKALDRSGILVAAMARPFQTPQVIVAYNATDPNNVVPFWLSTPVVVTPTPVTAKEFYASTLDHYFISASAPDLDAIESGRISGWAPTGQSLTVWAGTVDVALSFDPGFVAIPSQFNVPVCRFYIPPAYGDSHFFAANPEECASVRARFPELVLETLAAFYVAPVDVLPINGVTVQCPTTPVYGYSTPVYRLWNGRADTNHRYTTDPAIRDEMVARGWIAEGAGPDRITFCSY